MYDHKQPHGKYQTVQLTFRCFGAGAYDHKQAHDVARGERAFRFARAHVYGGAIYGSGYRVCAQHAQQMGAAPDSGTTRPDITVPLSRDLAAMRERVSTEYSAEKNAERKAIWASVIMDIDKVTQRVLDVNHYDEGRAKAS